MCVCKSTFEMVSAYKFNSQEKRAQLKVVRLLKVVTLTTFTV